MSRTVFLFSATMWTDILLFFDHYGVIDMTLDPKIEKIREDACRRFDELDATGTTARAVSDLHRRELGLPPRSSCGNVSDVVQAAEQSAELSKGLKPYVPNKNEKPYRR